MNGIADIVQVQIGE